MKKIICVVLVCLFLASSAFAGDGSHRIVLFKIDEGTLLVWDEPANYFSIEIHGKDVVPKKLGENLIFEVDGAFINLVSVPISKFLRDTEKMDELAILEAHRDWDIGYFQTALKAKLEPQSEKKILQDGGTALFTHLKMPKEADDKGDSVTEQLYLSVVRSNRVFGLNAALMKELKAETVEKQLEASMSTLHLSKEPIDVSAAAAKGP